jgi:hypothetical protein
LHDFHAVQYDITGDTSQGSLSGCAKSTHAVAGHFAEMRNMVGIGSGAQREVRVPMRIPAALAEHLHDRAV